MMEGGKGRQEGGKSGKKEEKGEGRGKREK